MPDSVWQRLGEALERRRVEIDPRYRNLALFARERGLNERLVGDIEHARRKGYRNGTRRALEMAYGLDTGRIDRFVAGEVSDLGGTRSLPAGDLPEDDPALKRVGDLPGLSPSQREGLLSVARTPGLDVAGRLLLVDITWAIFTRQAAENRSA